MAWLQSAHHNPDVLLALSSEMALPPKTCDAAVELIPCAAPAFSTAMLPSTPILLLKTGDTDGVILAGDMLVVGLEINDVLAGTFPRKLPPMSDAVSEEDIPATAAAPVVVA